MKMYVMICREVEVPDKFRALSDYENGGDADFEMHRELCKHIPNLVGLPLGSNAEPNAVEWIESVLDENGNIMIES